VQHKKGLFHLRWLMRAASAANLSAALGGGAGFHAIGFLSVGDASASPEHKREDRQVAKQLLQFACHLVGFRLANTLHHMVCMPGKLVLLLHPEPEVVSTCLAELRIHWHVEHVPG
jgi:uncharacterized protein (DUF2336 family)